MLRTVISLSAAAAFAVAQPQSAPNGKTLFEKNCAVCHRPGAENRTPLPDQLGQLSQQAIVGSLETGPMKAQGASLTPAERTAIARFLSKDASLKTTDASSNMCPAGGPLANIEGWNGWGVDLVNSRYQPAKAAGITAGDVPHLKLAWAF